MSIHNHPRRVTQRLVTFENEDDLREHALRLNEIGVHPDVSIMDANGNAVLACLAGCYADEFRYYSPGEDGYMHPEGCCECESDRSDWKPAFPVSALVGFDTSVDEPTMCPNSHGQLENGFMP